jgi:hypothetical protein
LSGWSPGSTSRRDGKHALDCIQNRKPLSLLFVWIPVQFVLTTQINQNAHATSRQQSKCTYHFSPTIKMNIPLFTNNQNAHTTSHQQSKCVRGIRTSPHLAQKIRVSAGRIRNNTRTHTKLSDNQVFISSTALQPCPKVS